MKRLSLFAVAVLAAVFFCGQAYADAVAPTTIVTCPPTCAPGASVQPGPAVRPAPKSFFDKPLIIDSSTVDGGAQSTTLSFGSILAQILGWVATVASGPLAVVATAWLYRLLKKLGIDNQEAYRGRLEDMVQNGIALAAQRAGVKLTGTIPIEVRGQIANDALAYVKDHGADTLKALGAKDVNDPKAEEATLARIAKALSDKIDPPPVSPVAAVAAVAPADAPAVPLAQAAAPKPVA